MPMPFIYTYANAFYMFHKKKSRDSAAGLLGSDHPHMKWSADLGLLRQYNPNGSFPCILTLMEQWSKVYTVAGA